VSTNLILQVQEETKKTAKMLANAIHYAIAYEKCTRTKREMPRTTEQRSSSPNTSNSSLFKQPERTASANTFTPSKKA